MSAQSRATPQRARLLRLGADLTQEQLAEKASVNAVFVTVEPKGGSAKPTGKPFLEAYLHSLPPNHP